MTTKTDEQSAVSRLEVAEDAAGCHIRQVSFLLIRLHAVMGPVAWLCQPRTVKSALSEAGVPICTW